MDVTAPHNPTPAPLWLRIGFWGCIVIAAAVAARRVFAIYAPPKPGPAELAGLDAWFAGHRALTMAHILPALLFVLAVPFAVYRKMPPWLEQLLYPVGAIVGLTAYAMSVYSVGGWLERSAVLVFNSVFITSLARSWHYGRCRNPMLQRRWFIRSVVVLLGIATTRPVMGFFFATSRQTHLQPFQFFGVAFWIGFSVNAVIVEWWLRRKRALVTAT